MKVICTAAIAATTGVLFALPGHAATFFAINSDVVKFNTGTSEADLIASNAAKVSINENTTVYIGTNQVSGINQDPIVTSFTNGVRNWTQSYDSSGIDGRGVGLLWDEDSGNLYGVFTADGGSQGNNTFGAATQGGWLSGYGSGGGAKASVLLKLNPDTGASEAGTFIRAQLPNGNTNTINPTGLDFVNDQVVFFGESFFIPLDVNGQRLTDPTPGAGSPFEYRVALLTDLTQATSAEAIGWDGVTQFSPLTADDETDDSDSGEPDDSDDETVGSGGDAETPDDDETDDSDSGETDDSDDDETVGSGGDAETPADDETDDSDSGETDDSDDDETVGSGGDAETPDDDSMEDDESADEDTPADGGDIVDDIEGGQDAESVPEPGMLIGLFSVLSMGWWRSRSRHTGSNTHSAK